MPTTSKSQTKRLALAYAFWMLIQTLVLGGALAEPRTPRDVEDLSRRLQAVQALLDDSNARFSASEQLAELEVLKKYADSRVIKQKQFHYLHDAVFMMGSINAKRGNRERGLELMISSASIGKSLLTSKVVKEASQIAELAVDLGRFDVAAQFYGEAAHSAKHVPDFSEDQQLGLREQQAYALHEAGQYEKALTINREVLAGGERLHGPESPVLRVVLTNIAQNLHALGRLSEIGPFLQRALASARAGDDFYAEQDLLFQLGVLTFEVGKPDGARNYMAERIALVKQRGDDSLLKSAEEDLEILTKKIREESSK